MSKQVKDLSDGEIKHIIAESHSWMEVVSKCGLKTLTRSLQKRVDKLEIDCSHFEKFFDGKHTKFNKFSKDEVETIVKDNTEWLSIMKALGYSTCAHVKVLQSKLDKLGIKYDHVDPKYESPWNRRELSDVLVKDSNHISMTTLKNRLKRELGWEHRCVQCKLTEWNGQPIPIQIDHINGDHWDNRLENLRFLCPNCHAQTDTYCGKNTKIHKDKKAQIVIVDVSKEQAPRKAPLVKNQRNSHKKKPDTYCEDCKKLMRLSKTGLCRACYNKSNAGRHVERPSHLQLLEDLSSMSMVKVGEKYGVSDNAVRKWIRDYEKVC